MNKIIWLQKFKLYAGDQICAISKVELLLRTCITLDIFPKYVPSFELLLMSYWWILSLTNIEIRSKMNILKTKSINHFHSCFLVFFYHLMAPFKSIIGDIFCLAIFLDFRMVCDGVHCTGNKGVGASVELTSAVIGENGVLRGR